MGMNERIKKVGFLFHFFARSGLLNSRKFETDFFNQEQMSLTFGCDLNPTFLLFLSSPFNLLRLDGSRGSKGIDREEPLDPI